MVAVVSVVWLELKGLFGAGVGVAIDVNCFALAGATTSMGDGVAVIVPIFAIAVPGGIIVVVVVVVAFGMHWNAAHPGPMLDPGPGGPSVCRCCLRQRCSSQRCVFFDRCPNGKIGVVFIYCGYLACGYGLFVCLLLLSFRFICYCCGRWLVGHLLCYGLCNRR